jgi:hypothetical protein
MTEITLQELEQLCQNYLNILPFYSQYEKLFFTILYETGCRPIEAHTYSLWEVKPLSNEIKLNAKKGNYARGIKRSNISPLVWDYFEAGTDKLRDYSLGKFSFIFDKFNKLGKLYNGNKGIDLYCFRALYVKKLKYEQGLEDWQIQEEMGWTNSHLPGIYYNSVIYFR